MDEALIVGTTQLNTPIYMSELSARTLEDNGLIGPSGGLYLYEASEDPADGGIRVLASVADTDAAYRLLDLLGVSTKCGGGGNGGGGGGGSNHDDPLISALIQKLPTGGTFDADQRVAWLQLMAMAFQVSYGAADAIEIKKAG